MLNLTDSIGAIGHIPPKHINELRKLGINTVSDLLFYLPYRYEDFSNLVNISDIKEGQNVTVKAKIIDIRGYPGFAGRANRAEAVVSDQSGSMKIVWFNQSYLAKNLKKGQEIFISGSVKPNGALQMYNPIHEKAASAESVEGQIHTARIVPIYRFTYNLRLRTLRTIIYKCINSAPEIKEYLPAETIKSLGLQDINTTIKNLHFPLNAEALKQAKKRRAFEEIFFVQLAVQKNKLSLQNKNAPMIGFDKSLVTEFLSTLPFQLTLDQKRALWDILQDIQKDRPMNRLLEGDVGSGKTLVAFIAALEAINRGYAAVMLCPTEILASQHYQNAIKYFENYTGFDIILLTSKSKKINGRNVGKKTLLQEIERGGARFIITTHAALEKNVKLKNVALVIIDEQHRFGVKQRANILEKSPKARPHMLSMSATPIPRSLKLTLFGDLEMSQIKHLPPGRKKIITKLVPQEKRELAYEFISKQLQAGRQAFVVTPLIDESDSLGVKAATSERENLQKIFTEYRVGLLHGRMKSAEKEKVMSDFLSGKSHVLVSTSIIEVGVDVPNATIMLIEGAERFGLAQLHQFRGRVGRSEHQSYCFVFSETANLSACERLEKFSKTSDGFELAEIDLHTRGFGNLFGEEQSGFHYFNYFSYSEHKELAKDAASLAKKILLEDPGLENHPQLKSKIANTIIHLE